MERMYTKDQDRDRLNGLLAAYRDACPEPEPGADFMPRLWQRIEARRAETTSIFKRLAQVCVATTAVAVLVLATMLTPAPPEDESVYASSYADVLATEHANAALVQALPAELPGDLR